MPTPSHPLRAALRHGLGLLRSLATYHGRRGAAAAARHLYGHFVRPGDLVFDLGAHVGDRSRAFRRLGAQVVAVEPQPLCLAVLRRLFARDSGVTVVPEAVGDRPGRATLLVSRRTPTVSTLSPDWRAEVAANPRFAWVRWDDEVVVTVTTLDALIARFGVPAFCKIDVEGFEAEVLAGLSRPLPALSFEYIPAARPRALACLRRLQALGPYVFQVSVGESKAFALPGWRDADSLAAWLRALPADADSGDIYARLVPNQNGPRSSNTS